MTRDDYVTVTTVLRRIRDEASLVDRARDDRVTVWIPRSCLHAADDLAVERAEIGAEVTIRVRRWKADRLELVPDKHQKAQRSLEL